MDSGVALPGPIRQIGYVVHDLDQAIASWVTLGVGPWLVMRGLAQRVTYRGQPCELTVSLAWANSGDLQVELIHQDDDAPSIFTEFLDSGRSGFHQLAYWTTDFPATLASINEAGWPVVWSGGDDVGTRFAYVESPDSPAAVIEIMELNDATEGMRKFLRDAADGWDGVDPVREVGA